MLILTHSTSSPEGIDEMPSGIADGSSSASSDPVEFTLADGIDAIEALECLLEPQIPSDDGPFAGPDAMAEAA